MKTLTMVMRCGAKGIPTNKVAYTLIDEDYSFVRLSGEELGNAIVGKKFIVTNMGVSSKGLVATNGAMDKYTMIDPTTNTLVGKASPVVLNRAEENGKLIGYVIFNTDGVLQTINVKQAVAIHGVTPFANGKIRHTNDGDIIQSIEGNYPIRVIEVAKAPVKELKLDLVFMGATANDTKKVKYVGVYVNCANAAMLAKLHGRLVGDNKSLIDIVYGISGDKKVYESLAVKRTTTAGFYAVIPFEALSKLIKAANNKITNNIGLVLVSCIKYEDGEGIESRVTLNNDLKPVGTIKGTQNGDTIVKKYTEEIVELLKGTTIVDELKATRKN